MHPTFSRSLVPFGLALCLASGAAQAELVATTLNFTSLRGPTGGLPMPDDHAGFAFGDKWYAMSVPAAPRNTFLALGSVGSTFISRSDRSDFYFDGASFWSRRGLDANGSFYFVLYHDGVTVYNGLEARKGRMRFSATPTRLKAAYKGPIDGMAFAFAQGGDDYDHLAMDNFRVRFDNGVAPLAAAAAVPEPGTALLSALGLVGLLAWRRRHGA